MRRNIHIVFALNGLGTYKEIFKLFPQFEALTDVIFLDDLSASGYKEMVKAFLQRTNIIDSDLAEQVRLPTALYEVRDRIRK